MAARGNHLSQKCPTVLCCVRPARTLSLGGVQGLSAGSAMRPGVLSRLCVPWLLGPLVESTSFRCVPIVGGTDCTPFPTKFGALLSTRRVSLQTIKHTTRMCYRQTMVRSLGALGLMFLFAGAVLVLTSPTFLCSVQNQDGCTGTCHWSCSETCFCTTKNHKQATVAAVPLLMAPFPLLLVCVWWCGDDPLPRACFCVREDPFEELVEDDESASSSESAHPLRAGFEGHED